jgi:serine protease AprX
MPEPQSDAITDAPEDRRYEQELQALAKASRIDIDQLQILDERTITLPELDLRVRAYKVRTARSDEAQRLAVDDRGRRQDIEAILEKQRALVRERYGSLQHALFEQLEQLREAGDEDRSIQVCIKFAIDEPEPLDKTRLEDGDPAKAAREAQQAERRVAAAALEVFRTAMARYGVEQRGEAEVSGPFVRTSLPATTVRELGFDESVAFLGLDGEPEVPDQHPTIQASLPTTRTNWVHGQGFRGAGVRVCILEGGGLTKAQSFFNVVAIQDTSASANDHMTKSVAITGNRYDQVPGTTTGTHGQWRGYAPEAAVMIANVSNYQSRYEWARVNGVNIVSMSWHFPAERTNGNLHTRDVYFDYWSVRWPWPSVFTSAGNAADEDAYAQGKGYNFLGVANVTNDGDGNRCNDVIESSSSWKNPISPVGDRELPEIAAPGSRHSLLDNSFGGTSAATPVAAAITSLLMNRNTALRVWPEGIRAILLATSNYQGADGANWSIWSDGRDGTGMVNAQYAMWTAGRRETGQTAQFRAHDYGRIRHADFQGGFFNKSWNARTSTTNARIRVALTWNSKTSGSTPTSSVLDADLDLWVYDPDGQLVAWSSSWDGNYEFVEFTPSKPGTYRIRIRRYAMASNFDSYFGIAWTTHYELC